MSGATEAAIVGRLTPAGPVVLGDDDPGDAGLAWFGEYEVEPAAEPDSDLERWTAIRTVASPAVAVELRRRFDPEALIELAEDPCMWNLTAAAIEAGPAILEMHRNDPAAPAERPRGYIAAAMRREAMAVMRASRHERPVVIRKARQSLERFVMQGLTGRELDRFVSGLEGVDHG
jgi:hypothetical protein